MQTEGLPKLESNLQTTSTREPRATFEDNIGIHVVVFWVTRCRNPEDSDLHTLLSR
jgi:hypothetical protein